MQISTSMLIYYLNNVTVGWFDHQDLPPEQIQEYDIYINDIKLGATEHHDLETLKLAFEYILTHPEIDCEAFAGGRYPFDNEEIREIIHYAWKTIWPEAKEINRDTLPEIELVTMSLQDWWNRNQDSTLNS